jgi:hypothetical protein
MYAIGISNPHLFEPFQTLTPQFYRKHCKTLEKGFVFFVKWHFNDSVPITFHD